MTIQIASSSVNNRYISTSNIDYTKFAVSTTESSKALLIFIDSVNNTNISSVSYENQPLTQIKKTSFTNNTENGFNEVWFLNSNISSGPFNTPVNFTSIVNDSFTPITDYDTLTWSTVVSYYDLDYGNGYWCAVGNYYDTSFITYSNNLLGTWSIKKGNIDFNGSSLYSLKFLNNYWILCCSSGIYYTTNPSANWTRVLMSDFGVVYSIEYANGYYVAVGGAPNSNVISYSTDLVNWSQTSLNFNNSDLKPLYSIKYANGYWVAVGSNGCTVYASNPTSAWNKMNFTSNYVVRDVVYGNGYWVAVGNNGQSLYTTDITGTWSTNSNYVGATKLTYANGYFFSNSRRYTTNPTGAWSSSNSSIPYSNDLGNLILKNDGAVKYYNNQWVIIDSGIEPWPGYSGPVPHGVLSISAGELKIQTNAIGTIKATAVVLENDNNLPLSIVNDFIDTTQTSIGEKNISSNLNNALRFGSVYSVIDSINLNSESIIIDTVTSGFNSQIIFENEISNITNDYWLVSSTALVYDANSNGNSSWNNGPAPSPFLLATPNSTSFTTAGIFKAENLPANAFISGFKKWGLQLYLEGAMTGNVIRYKFQRQNSSGVVQSESNYVTKTLGYGGIVFYTFCKWASGTWNLNDKLVLILEHKGYPSNVTLHPIVSFVRTPKQSNVVGIVCEKQQGIFTRSVGFKSDKIDKQASIYFAVQEEFEVTNPLDFNIGSIPIL